MYSQRVRRVLEQRASAQLRFSARTPLHSTFRSFNMPAANIKQRRGFTGSSKQQLPNDGGAASSRGSGDVSRPSSPKAADSAKAKPTGNKRSLTFAIGGVLTLLGVASYTFFLRQPSSPTAAGGNAAVGVPTATQTQAQAALQSVALKRDEARKKLDGLSVKERREQARRLGLLTEEEVDAILHAKEKSWCLDGDTKVGTGLRLRVDTNQVSSNDPIEDYLAWDIVQPRGAVPKDGIGAQAPSRFMFGVFDGHAGYMCAEQIAARIGPMLNESLELVRRSTTPQGANNGTPLAGTVKQLAKEAGLDWDHTSLALTATFINMDYELVHGALADFRKSQNLMRMDQLLGPAVSGSCGLVAVVDAKAEEVVVGNTGDSRALLGVRLDNGTWKAVRLSEDQTASNKNELARMNREHPGETAVIRKGRVLGGLMPTRAFGDCRYKWSLETQQDLFPVLYARGHRYATTPPNYSTPPYVTARPVIVKHQLSENDKFIVMASDGLYDQLSDAEVIDTVAQWYEAHNKGKGSEKTSSTLTTEDDNAATHLIRTALSTDRLGRRSDDIIRRLLAIPPPHSRRFRDDISVTVITLDRDEKGAD